MTGFANKTISFRPLTMADFVLLERWFSEPHIEKWWHEPHDRAHIIKKYGPRVEGSEPTHVFVIEYEGKPIGWIQWYRWADYPAHAEQLGAGATAAGIDLGIGEKEMVGVGIGARSIQQFITQVVFANPAIDMCIGDPEEDNFRSLRAFETAGFTVVRTIQLQGETVRRKVVRLGRVS